MNTYGPEDSEEARKFFAEHPDHRDYEQEELDQIQDQVVEHEGRWYWAWQTDDGRWYAPYRGRDYSGVQGSLAYCCSCNVYSRKRRRDLIRLLRSEDA